MKTSVWDEDAGIETLSTEESILHPDNYSSFRESIVQAEASVSNDQEEYTNISAEVEFMLTIDNKAPLVFVIRRSGIDQHDWRCTQSIVLDAEFKIRYETDCECSD